ncbi:AarF/UbiB family protein [Myxococcota bacterium]|nr:AarF/UbiB family protein [Myxococcota bacterium]
MAQPGIGASKLNPRRSQKIARAVQAALDKKNGGTASVDGAPPSATSVDPLEALDELLERPLAKVWTVDNLSPGARFVDFGGYDGPGEVAALPRRKRMGGAGDIHTSPPMAHTIHFQAGFFATLIRLAVWLSGIIRFFGGNFLDSLIGRNTTKRQAERLRRTLERLGPTFIKLGQQMSVRADVLPYEYCSELSKMLDKVPAFPTEQAVETIERAMGKKITEVFAIFDPTPIGSASLACVYQAYLKTGHKVAVKVRRPRIGQVLAGDMRALRWIMGLAELASLVRPGLTRNFLRELFDMLMEELDFNREARFTEIFRSRAQKQRLNFISAPRIYRDLSSEEVMVSEFVSGVFLWEILSAIDRNDTETLAQIAEQDIHPEQVARNMAELFNWESMESLLFHADPHPANIVVRPGSTIILLDFGSCGRFSSKIRRLFHQLHYYMNAEDVQGMVECSIAMLEPLPPIDVDRFTKEVEALYWELMYASKDEHSEWWEKASGVLWIRFAGIARSYNIPINLDTLRLFRATFLYDTVMFRLWKDLDLDEEYQRYFRKAGRRSKKRVQKQWRRRLFRGPTNKDYQRIEEFQRMGNQMLGRIQQFLDTPNHNFASVIGKAAYGATMFLRVILAGTVIHLVATIAVAIFSKWSGTEITMWSAFTQMVSTLPYQITVLVLGVIIIRKALMRFADIDV